MSDARAYCGILLAAGRSTRFGGDKLLHPLADGAVVAVASARALRAALPRSVAVIARGNQALWRLLEAEGLEVVAAPLAGGGMGASLAAGIAAMEHAPGWVVALADMPYIRPATVSRVGAALAAGSPLAAPAYRGQRGHPVGFDRRFRAELLALGGEAGARRLVEAHRQLLQLIDCDDAGVLRDIDRPADLY